MAFAGTPGPASGRIARLYINADVSTQTAKKRSDSPAGTTTYMEEVARIHSDNYTPGKRGFVEADIRSQYQKLKLEGASDLGSLKFSYVRAKGITDNVYHTLFDYSQPNADPIEFFVADDDITLEGCTYDRLFCQLSRVGEDRDLGKVVATDFEAVECTHYEDVTGTETIMPTVSESTPAA